MVTNLKDFINHLRFEQPSSIQWASDGERTNLVRPGLARGSAAPDTSAR
jgi:hypothetical protein